MAYFKARVGSSGGKETIVNPLFNYFVGTSTGSTRTYKLHKNDVILIAGLHSVISGFTISNAELIESHYTSGNSNYNAYRVLSDGNVTITITNSNLFLTYEIFTKSGSEISVEAISVSGTGQKTISGCEEYDILSGCNYNSNPMSQVYPYTNQLMTTSVGSGTTYITTLRVVDADSTIINVSSLNGGIVYKLH